MNTSISCIAETAALAERIIDALLGQGIRPEDISLFAPAGSAAGTIIGNPTALRIGSISAATAQHQAGSVRRGRIPIAVRAEDAQKASHVRSLLAASGASDIAFS